jgi:hypothetical protein
MKIRHKLSPCWRILTTCFNFPWMKTRTSWPSISSALTMGPWQLDSDKKYRALGVKSFDTSILQKNISYYEGIIILGLSVVRTLSTLARRKMKDRTRDSYSTDLCPNSRCNVSVRFSFLGFCMWHKFFPRRKNK